MISSIISGPLSDSFGRRPIILGSSVVFVVGALVMAIAQDYTVFVVGRFIVGLGVGSASCSMPVFVSEAAAPKLRGTLVTCVNLALTFGQFIAACVSGMFITTQGGWRWMVGLAAVPATIQFIGFLYLPESPRWLLEHGYIDQAVSALRLLRGCDDVKEEVQEVLDVIRKEQSLHNRHIMSKLVYGSKSGGKYQPVDEDSLDDPRAALLPPKPSDENPVRGGSLHSISSGNSKTQNHGTNRGTNDTDATDTTDETDTSDFVIPGKTFWEDFSTSWVLLTSNVTTRRALLLGCALQAAQQIGGINTIMYYTATILKFAGFSSDVEAVWLSAAVAFCNVLGTVIGLYFVDRVGRRRLTLASLSIVCVALIAIGVVFYIAQHQSPHVNTNTVSDINNCNQYQYCFDCVQDDSCGYCSDYNPNPDGNPDANTGLSACVAGDDDIADEDRQCRAEHYYGSACPGSTTVTIGWIIFFLLCSYLLAFAPGMGPMPWCINSEIYPTSVRGIANSMATAVNWSTNFAMSASFLTLMSVATRTGAFFLYAFVSTLFLIFFYFYLPETKGVNLEKIELLFEDKSWGYASGSTFRKNDNSSDVYTNTGLQSPIEKSLKGVTNLYGTDENIVTM